MRGLEEDFVRVWPCPWMVPGRRVLEEERVLDVEALRRWRDCVSGGRERSFLVGSVVSAGG